MSQSFIIAIAAVLIIAVVILIFRLQVLVSVARGSYRKRAGMSNNLNAIMFVAFFVVGFGAFGYFTYHLDYHLPLASSEHGVKTDFMFFLTMGILVVAFVITHIFLVAFIVKYRYKEGRKAYFYPENHKLEVVWTIIPAIVMVVLVYYGYVTWNDIFKQAPANRVELELMGQQFAWEMRYPGKDNKLGQHHFRRIDDDNYMGLILEDPATWDDFMPNPKEIHIPKGKPVLLRIRSRDVLHSVYLPHFRVKMDAVPGMPTTFLFTPTQTTAEKRAELGDSKFNYELACAELCGKSHYSMRRILVVDEPEEYEAWLAKQKAWALDKKDYVLKNIKPEMRDKAMQALGGVVDTATVSVNIPADTTTKGDK